MPVEGGDKTVVGASDLGVACRDIGGFDVGTSAIYFTVVENTKQGLYVMPIDPKASGVEKVVATNVSPGPVVVAGTDVYFPSGGLMRFAPK